MQIFTQTWLNGARNYLNSVSTLCSNGESTDHLCLKSDQYDNLIKVINDFGAVHRQTESALKDVWGGRSHWEHRCLIDACFDEENCCNDENWTERGVAFSTRVRYLGPDKKQAPNEYTQLAFYKETFECKTPIDLPSRAHKRTEFGSEEMLQSWEAAGWNATTCEWQVKYCKVPRFANVTHVDDTGIRFECRDAVCVDRNSIETGADCRYIADEKLAFDAPFTRHEIPSGILPLVAESEMKDPWLATVGTVSALVFSLLTVQAICNYRSLSQIEPDHASSTPPPKTSLRPAWACAVAATASAAAALCAYQNLTRVYSASFL